MFAKKQYKRRKYDLVECLVTDVAFVSLLPRVRQTVVLVVSLLVEALPTELTDPGLVPVVDPHVGVEGGAPVEGLPTGHALVWLLVGVDDLVSAQSGGLSEAFPAYFAHKRSGSCKQRVMLGGRGATYLRKTPLKAPFCSLKRKEHFVTYHSIDMKKMQHPIN